MPPATGRDHFVYMAAYGAKLAAKSALDGDNLRYDNSAMPAIVFTDPQVASVGLTETAVGAAGQAVRVSTIALDQAPRALAARDPRGLVKLATDAGSGRLLGAHILAPEGADSIQTATLAIRQGLTVNDIAETILSIAHDRRGLQARGTGLRQAVALCRLNNAVGSGLPGGIRSIAADCLTVRICCRLGSCFLCADLGIAPELEPRQDHVSYLQSRLTVLSGDKRAIIHAAAHAQRAAAYLHDVQPAEQQDRQAA